MPATRLLGGGRWDDDAAVGVRHPVAAGRARRQPFAVSIHRPPFRRLTGGWRHRCLTDGWRHRCFRRQGRCCGRGVGLRFRLRRRGWRESPFAGRLAVFRRPAMRSPQVRLRRGLSAAASRRWRGIRRWRRAQRLLGHVDDRVLRGHRAAAGVLGAHRRDPAALDTPGHRRHRRRVAGPVPGPIALERGPLTQVRVEQDLQVGPQRRQLRPQCGHLVGGLRAQLGGQLAAQLRLDASARIRGGPRSRGRAAGRRPVSGPAPGLRRYRFAGGR